MVRKGEPSAPTGQIAILTNKIAVKRVAEVHKQIQTSKRNRERTVRKEALPTTTAHEAALLVTADQVVAQVEVPLAIADRVVARVVQEAREVLQEEDKLLAQQYSITKKKHHEIFHINNKLFGNHYHQCPKSWL